MDSGKISLRQAIKCVSSEDIIRVVIIVCTEGDYGIGTVVEQGNDLTFLEPVLQDLNLDDDYIVVDFYHKSEYVIELHWTDNNKNSQNMNFTFSHKTATDKFDELCHKYLTLEK